MQLYQAATSTGAGSYVGIPNGNCSSVNRGLLACTAPARPTALLSLHSCHLRLLLQVGAIVPWNYPFHNVLNPLTAALFAGNALVIKVRGSRGRVQGGWVGRSLACAWAGLGNRAAGRKPKLTSDVLERGMPLLLHCHTLMMTPQVSEYASWSIRFYPCHANSLPTLIWCRPGFMNRLILLQVSECASWSTGNHPCRTSSPYSYSCHAGLLKCPVLLQVSEYASWSTGYYGRLINAALEAAGAPPNLVQFVTGYGEAGGALVTGGE